MEPVKRQFGRLHVEPSDLQRRGVNSPLFSLAYLALKAAGAKDWYSGLGLSLTHQGKLHFIQWHHVIPKSLCPLTRRCGAPNAIVSSSPRDAKPWPTA